MKPNMMNGDRSQSRTSSHATAAPSDVADTLRLLRARSPEESLGLTDENGLLKGFLWAAAGAVVILAAMTLGDYLMHKQSPNSATAAAPQEQPKAPDATPANTPAAPVETGPVPPAAKSPSDNPGTTVQTPPKDFDKKLGETGTKKSNPGVNPLDKKDDDLFKDLK